MADDRALMCSVPYDRLPGTDFKREMKSLSIIFTKIWTKMCRQKYETEMKTVYFPQIINIITFFLDITFGCGTYLCW